MAMSVGPRLWSKLLTTIRRTEKHKFYRLVVYEENAFWATGDFFCRSTVVGQRDKLAARLTGSIQLS